MKKNKWMRLASLLLVLCLITTCTVSGTYAKYTTQDSAVDVARVAKWGVEVRVGGSLFGPHYDGTNHRPLTWEAIDKATVSAYATSAAAADNLVAPGTNGYSMYFSINGQPEVSGVADIVVQYDNVFLKANTYGVMVELGPISNFAYDTYMASTAADGKLYVKGGDTFTVATAYSASTNYYTLEDYVVLDKDYYPVEFELGGTTTYNVGYSAGHMVNTLEKAVEELTATFGTATATTTTGTHVTNTYQIEFSPNTDLADLFELDNEKIAWKWDFCQLATECDNGDAACTTCKADTILGNLQATPGSTALNGTVVKLDGDKFVAPVEFTDYNLNVAFGIDITVTQVD